MAYQKNPKTKHKLTYFLLFGGWGAEISGFFPTFGTKASRLALKKAGVKGGIPEAASAGLMLYLCV